MKVFGIVLLIASVITENTSTQLNFHKPTCEKHSSDVLKIIGRDAALEELHSVSRFYKSGLQKESKTSPSFSGNQSTKEILLTQYLDFGIITEETRLTLSIYASNNKSHPVEVTATKNCSYTTFTQTLNRIPPKTPNFEIGKLTFSPEEQGIFRGNFSLQLGAFHFSIPFSAKVVYNLFPVSKVSFFPKGPPKQEVTIKNNFDQTLQLLQLEDHSVEGQILQSQIPPNSKGSVLLFSPLRFEETYTHYCPVRTNLGIIYIEFEVWNGEVDCYIDGRKCRKKEDLGKVVLGSDLYVHITLSNPSKNDLHIDMIDYQGSLGVQVSEYLPVLFTKSQLHLHVNLKAVPESSAKIFLVTNLTTWSLQLVYQPLSGTVLLDNTNFEVLPEKPFKVKASSTYPVPVTVHGIQLKNPLFKGKLLTTYLLPYQTAEFISLEILTPLAISKLPQKSVTCKELKSLSENNTQTITSEIYMDTDVGVISAHIETKLSPPPMSPEKVNFGTLEAYQRLEKTIPVHNPTGQQLIFSVHLATFEVSKRTCTKEEDPIIKKLTYATPPPYRETTNPSLLEKLAFWNSNKVYLPDSLRSSREQLGFFLKDTQEHTLSPGESVNIPVIFQPSFSGSFAAKVLIRSNLAPLQAIEVYGNSILPDLELSSPLRFDVTLDEMKNQTAFHREFFFHNKGDQKIQIKGIWLQQGVCHLKGVFLKNCGKKIEIERGKGFYIKLSYVPDFITLLEEVDIWVYFETHIKPLPLKVTLPLQQYKKMQNFAKEANSEVLVVSFLASVLIILIFVLRKAKFQCKPKFLSSEEIKQKRFDWDKTSYQAPLFIQNFKLTEESLHSPSPVKPMRASLMIQTSKPKEDPFKAKNEPLSSDQVFLYRSPSSGKLRKSLSLNSEVSDETVASQSVDKKTQEDWEQDSCASDIFIDAYKTQNALFSGPFFESESLVDDFFKT